MDSLDETTRPDPPLRRRNSIATSVVIPAKLKLPGKPRQAASFLNGTIAAASSSSSMLSSCPPQSFPAVDFELISFKPLSYTSLKDVLLSSAVQSPSAAATPGGSQSGYEISIRNRLVKQAAWAYLQPMSSSPSNSVGRHFLHRLWDKISGYLLKNPVTSFLRSVTGNITRAFDNFLRAIWHRSIR